ncbi:MAG: hypothetical protein Q9179_001764 [Wetmoreana sp. 5 TL-2023]
MAACTAVAWIFSLELILTVAFILHPRSDCYFWALLVSSAGCIIHALGFVLKFLVGTSWLVDLAFIGLGLPPYPRSKSIQSLRSSCEQRAANIWVAGWVAMVSGQSFVLWSRLHLVVRNPYIIRGVLAAIIIDGFALHIPTLVFIYGANSPSRRWVDRFNTMERIQLLGFSMQEFAIGGIYIIATVKLLRAIYYPGLRKAMLQLLAISCICLAMDVILIGFEFTNHYVAEASAKPLIYAVKLKLEFAVYRQLVGFTKAAFEDNEATDPLGASGEYQPRQHYNSPADFFKNIPSVLRKPPPLAPYPTIHTHPEQFLKADRALCVVKVDREWDHLELSPNNAAAILTASAGQDVRSVSRDWAAEPK